MPADRINRRTLTSVLPLSNPQGQGGGPTDSQPAQHRDEEVASDPIEDDGDVERLSEPDLDVSALIITGRHVWSATRSDALVPFEDLPLPKTDRAKLPPSTIRWQFTGEFSPNCDEGLALVSLRKQLKAYMAARGVKDFKCMVNFPIGTGRNKMVDITILPQHLMVASGATLVYRQSKLQRLFVGPALDFNYFVIEIKGFTYTNSTPGTATRIWAGLRQYVKVHDIWMRQISYADDDDEPPQDQNIYLALVSVQKDDENRIDPGLLAAIPGYIKIGADELTLSFTGRLDWCTTCKSRTELFHTFETCPRRQCNKCKGFGHLSANCKSPPPAAAGGDQATAAQQARDAAAGALNLNYGS